MVADLPLALEGSPIWAPLGTRDHGFESPRPLFQFVTHLNLRPGGEWARVGCESGKNSFARGSFDGFR